MADVKIGAQLYTCREFTQTTEDFADCMKKVADIGYTSVQISAIGPIDPKEVARICQDNGLAVAATHRGWPEFLESLDELIDIHKLWGCNHPAVGGLPGEYRGPDGIKQFVDELGPVAEALAKAGMDFSYHNHSHELIKHDGKTWLQTLYDAAPADILKAEIDTYWITHGGGDPVWWLNYCAGREPVIHFKDMGRSDEGQIMTPIGEGNLNWPSIIEAAKAGGVEYALIEQDQCYDRTPLDCLESSYQFLTSQGLS